MADELVPFDVLDDVSPGLLKRIWGTLRLLLGEANPLVDARLKSTFEELMHEVQVEDNQRLHGVVREMMRRVVREEQWETEPPHTRPTVLDVLSRMTDYAEENIRAGSHGKRRILWNAFFSSFDPKFYKDGMATHLWRLAKELEYPELRFLREYREWERKPMSVDSRAPKDDFLIRQLVNSGLLVENITSRANHRTTDIVDRLIEFVWDNEMWNVDGSPKAG